MGRILRLGTRRSTLAWAQSAWVAEQLRSLDPAVTIELVPIETRGDRITHVPLREIEGKDFFTAELDAALLDSHVDLSVHSLKDLSLERPPGIRLGAIPKRENPRDVVIFRADALARSKADKPLRIGTSAPRRLENVPPFLKQALPGSPRLSFVEIRGNVDTRLSRLHEPQPSERRLEGVVLAFAGLIRLWRDVRPEGRPGAHSGRDRLSALLNGTRWMVLPVADCPAAPGQGALAVECRTDDASTFALLQKLHDAQSATQIGRERAVLARFGGGCHQKFGATCIDHPECGRVLYVRGKDAQGHALDGIEWLSPPPPPHAPVRAWDGSKQTMATTTTIDGIERIAASSAPLFVAHSRALPPGAEAALENRRVWTSGVASWRRLAERGVWVEGCADGLGYDWIAPTLREPVLGLPALEHWQILTHAAAVPGWPAGETLATYTSHPENGAEAPPATTVTHVFWSSGNQFQNLRARLPAAVHHACGPGKTAQIIRAAGITNLAVFPSPDEWRRWLNLPND